MVKDGFHQGGPDTQEPKIGSCQSRSHLRSRVTPITVLKMGGRKVWMCFLVVENLVDDCDQFNLELGFARNLDVMIDLNKGLISIRNLDRK